MIFGRHSVLKRGCSTWDKAGMPQEEFERRLDAARREMAQRNLDALVIYGDNYSFGDLCYLTNYFPKVRGGFAVVPRQGAISLLLHIGSRDIPFAKSLTWVDDVRASGQIGRDAAKIVKEKTLAKAKIGLMDSGKGLPLPQWEEMKSALPEVGWQECHALFEQMRLRKSPRELSSMRRAGALLRDLCQGVERFVRTGRKEYEVIADIDRLARDGGAEDIRVLAGAKRLQPPSFNMNGTIDRHWSIYLAIQHERYWVETGRSYILSGDGKLNDSYQKARDTVARMAAGLTPGGATKTVSEAARQSLADFYTSAVNYGFGQGIGLNQWEAPFLSPDDARQVGAPAVGAAAVEENMTMALRAVLESADALVLFGDSLEVTKGGAKSLLAQ